MVMKLCNGCDFQNGTSFWFSGILDATTRDTGKREIQCFVCSKKRIYKICSRDGRLHHAYLLCGYVRVFVVCSSASTFPCNYARSGVVFENVDELLLLTLKHYGRRYHVSLSSLRGKIVDRKKKKASLNIMRKN